MVSSVSLCFWQIFSVTAKSWVYLFTYLFLRSTLDLHLLPLWYRIHYVLTKKKHDNIIFVVPLYTKVSFKFIFGTDFSILIMRCVIMIFICLRAYFASEHKQFSTNLETLESFCFKYVFLSHLFSHTLDHLPLIDSSYIFPIFLKDIFLTLISWFLAETSSSEFLFNAYYH